MVHFKAALWSVLVGLAVASAFPHRDIENDNALARRDGLFPRGEKTVDPAKIERMRKNLGPQDPVEEEDEEEGEEPTLRIQTAPNAPATFPQQKTNIPASKSQTTNNKIPASKTKRPAPKPTINVKDNSPAPEIYRNSNNGKVADSILELKRKKQSQQDRPQKGKPQQRKPAAPKRPSPRQPIQEEEEEEEEEEEIEVRPAPKKSGKKPQPQGSSLKQPSEKAQAPGKSPKQQPEKKQPQGPGKQRPSSKKQAPAPEEDEGANQQSPQTSKPSSARSEKKQKPNRGKPKLPSPGPSKFQNKKAEKFGGPKVAPQPSQDGDDDDDIDSFSAPRPAPKKKPQISPDISQGGPKDRSDGSRPRKQAGAKPKGSKFQKQGPVSEDDDYDYDVQGSERAAKDAVQTAGAPRNGPGPSQNRKINNAPRTKNQATAKRPNSQPGVAEDTAGAAADQPKASGGGGGDSYFKWFRASEQRPTDFVASNRDGWKTKYPVPDTKPEAPPPAPAPPATGIEKLPSNQRQREREQQEAAAAAAQKEQNRRASRRENF